MIKNKIIGFVDCFCQQMKYDDKIFIDSVVVVLQHIGFDYSESKDAMLLFSEESQTERAQECLKEGGRDFKKQDMLGLAILLNRKTPSYMNRDN